MFLVLLMIPQQLFSEKNLTLIIIDEITIPILQEEFPIIKHNGIKYGMVRSPYTGKIWLDRNIGASRVCLEFNDPQCYGDYYQWGRYPDGHQNKYSNTTNTLATNVNNVGHAKFILSDNSNDFDWASNDKNGYSRSRNWSKTDGTSVCPKGFRVPTFSELEAELLKANSAEIQGNIDAFKSFLALPSTGYRSGYSASIFNAGSDGQIWSIDSNDYNHVKVLLYYDDVATLDFHPRSYTASIRCIKD
jgi:uncharacterized protein (TIGR02145 family)